MSAVTSQTPNTLPGESVLCLFVVSPVSFAYMERVCGFRRMYVDNLCDRYDGFGFSCFKILEYTATCFHIDSIFSKLHTNSASFIYIFSHISQVSSALYILFVMVNIFLHIDTPLHVSLGQGTSVHVCTSLRSCTHDAHAYTYTTLGVRV